jgi:hypothetical protein
MSSSKLISDSLQASNEISHPQLREQRRRLHPDLRKFAHKVAFFPGPLKSFNGNVMGGSSGPSNASSQTSSASERSSLSTSSGYQGSSSKSSPDPTLSVECDLPPAAPNSELETIVMDQDQGILFMMLFGDLCAALTFCYEGCSDDKCFSSHHELPSAEVVEKKLNSYSKSDVEDFLALVSNFMPEVRARYLSAFANLYATRKEPEKMKNLIKICQKSSRTVSCLEHVVDALVRKGWEVVDAIQFLIENHEDRKDARQVIMTMIKRVNDDSKFAEYIAKGIKVEKNT